MKILIVDDQTLIREALRGVLQHLDDVEIILEASDFCQTLRLIEKNPDLDLILLDLTLPDRSGLGMLAELRESLPATSVVVMSAHQDRNTVVEALTLGALGFIPKSAQHADILNALRTIVAGGIYVPSGFLAGERAVVREPSR
jgi:DNA-binding NarL/FixJ family response regulator